VTAPAFTPTEVARLRDDTPGCAHVAHLNNAGASLMPSPVLAALHSHLDAEATMGGYEAEAAAAERLDAAHTAIAELVGGAPEEVALTENQTRAWDMAFYGVDLRPGDRILTTHAEYSSQYYALLDRARRTGAGVEVLADDEHGQLSLDALEQALDDRVRVVSIVHAPTFGGLVNPVAEAGALLREHPRALYFLDATQSAGQLPLDVAAIGCDVLAATGRKYVRGPRGTGFLWVRRERMEEIAPAFPDLRGAEWESPTSYRLHPTARRYETWETNVAGRIGLGVAARYALDLGVERIAAQVARLASALRRRLSELPGVTLQDTGEARSGIVTFTVSGATPDEVKEAARSESINVYTIDMTDARLAFEPRGLASVVRASVHCFTTEDELDRLAEVVDGVARS
jgi:cysteine desulfurase/selenocysteine lyase